MGRIYGNLAGGIASVIVAVIIAKAQLDTKGRWGFILKDPHVIPGLAVVALLFFAITLGQVPAAGRGTEGYLSFYFPKPSGVPH